MNDRIQVLVGDGGQLDQPHASIVSACVRDVVGAAVDRDLVPTLDQPLAQLLYTGLKATITGGDATGAEESNFKTHATKDS